MPIDALSVLAQLTRDLLAIAKFLLIKTRTFLRYGFTRYLQAVVHSTRFPAGRPTGALWDRWTARLDFFTPYCLPAAPTLILWLEDAVSRGGTQLSKLARDVERRRLAAVMNRLTRVRLRFIKYNNKVDHSNRKGSHFCCSFVENLFRYLFAKIIKIERSVTNLLWK